MSKVEEIKAQINALSEDERVILWDWMLGNEDAVDPQWEKRVVAEAVKRRQDVAEGRSKLLTAEEVKQHIKDRYGYEL